MHWVFSLDPGLAYSVQLNTDRCCNLMEEVESEKSMKFNEKNTENKQ